MDQNTPDYLKETSEASFKGSEAFCRRLAGQDRVRLSKRLDLPVQSHLAETLPESQWVSELFPESRSYTDVYNDCGLLGPASLMAHAIFSRIPETRYKNVGSLFLFGWAIDLKWDSLN